MTFPSCSSISASFRGKVRALAASTAAALHVLLVLLISPVVVELVGPMAAAAPFLLDAGRPLLLLLALLALPVEGARALRTARVMKVVV